MDSVLMLDSKRTTIASVCAATKKYEEGLCICFGCIHSIPPFTLRFLRVFGPGHIPGNPNTGAVAIRLSPLLSGQALLMLEDGIQRRSFTEVRGVAMALDLA
jgi:dTDP-L-rhamnose 4-epimerase